MANIKSNDFSDIPFPSDFTDEDKNEYMRLLNLSKFEHADIYEKEKWIIHYAIIMHIRKENGKEVQFTEDELKEIVSKFENAEWRDKKEVVCTGKEHPYLYDKENNPIFKDNSYFFKNDDDGNVAETKAENIISIN